MSDVSPGPVARTPAPRPRAVICTDMEGIGGIDGFEDCFPSWPAAYRRGRELMEGETNAVIAGLRDAGVEDIVVTDWHFAGTNLRRDRVDAPVRGLWVDGEPVMRSRLDDGRPVYGDRDLAIFVGMHAAAGASSFMAHTFWQGLALEIDGTPVNEAYLWSTMVGAVGARIGFVAGEERIVDECAVLLPGAPTVAVKSSRSRDRAVTTRRVEDLREELRQQAHDAAVAVAGGGAGRPRIAGPVGRELRVTFHEQAWARRAAARGLGEQDGARTIATRLSEPDGLIPLLAGCTLAMPGGAETRLYHRVAPAPEWASRPEAVRRALTSCVHAVGRPLMRRGVVATQRMDQSRYPRPPGEPGGRAVAEGPPGWVQAD